MADEQGNRVKRGPASASVLRSLSSLLQGGEGQGEEGLAARKVQGVGGAGPVRAAPASPRPSPPPGVEREKVSKPVRMVRLSFTRLP
jgi:hypothetical protein